MEKLKLGKQKAEIGGQRATWSGGLAGFQLVNHAPNAVGLAALDDLERGGAVKGGVGVFESGANRFGRDEVHMTGPKRLGSDQKRISGVVFSFVRKTRPDRWSKGDT